MKPLTYLLALAACLGISGLASAAPPKVALLPEDAALRATLSSAGAQVVEPASAEVVVITSPAADRASVEAAAKRGGGVVVLGEGITAGEWLKPIAGAAWTPKSQKFTTKHMLFTLTDAHPIMRHATAFDYTGEGLYDLDLDQNLQVLASIFTPKVTGRRAAQRPGQTSDKPNVYDLQPQIWSFEDAQKHRAVVILPAKGETLQHASIRTFILRGLSWAAGHENVDELLPQQDVAVLRYPAGGARPAAETVKSFQLTPGFKASVIASEPLITKPIAMQWDGQGRLWIAETPEYPNGRRPLTTDAWKETGVLDPGHYDRPARDRISILSDPDANGQFTKKTVFHEGLELITGFCLYGDGVIVVAQPDIVFIHGEGANQKVERLYSGFTPGDTHFVANHFVAAPDGWIYANTGSGPGAKSVSHPEVRAQLSPGVFRFKPDGSAIEQVGSKGGNAFGLDITSDGEIFCGQATTGNPVQHIALPEGVLSKGKVGAAVSEESVIKGRKVIRSDMPDRAPFMQIDVVGGFTAACASSVYEAGAWPAQWNGSVFCAEPILDIIHQEKLVPNGVSYTGEMTRTDAEWLRANDFWFFPVDVQFGPDGAMYVLDFYCPIVAHNDTRGPLHSKSGASVRPDRDHFFGRIYRIQAEGAQPAPLPDFAKATPEALVSAFSHSNRLIRFTALRLLMDRPDAAAAVPALVSLAQDTTSVNPRILALWALERLQKLSPELLQSALKSENTGVRKSALLVADALAEKNKLDLGAMLNDPEPRVRLLALRAMASSPLTTEGAAALLAALPKLDDDWSRSAAIAAASSNAGPVLEAALASTQAPSNALLDLASSLARSLAEKRDSETLARVILAAQKSAVAVEPARAAVLVRTVLEAIRPIPSAPTNSSAAVAEALRVLLNSRDAALSASALPLAAAWASEPLQAPIAEKITGFLAITGDSTQPDAVRAASIRALLAVRANDARISPAAIALLQEKLSEPLTLELVSALAATGEPAFGKPLVSALPNLTPAAQSAAFEALAGRADWSNAVLDALEGKTLKAQLLGPARLSKLRLHSDPATAKRAFKVIDAVGGGTNPAKDDLIAKLQPEIEAKPGNAANGKALFTATCAVCHKFNGEGKEVGPVLDGIGVHGVHELLVHIIDPSRVVDDEHRTWNIALKHGSFATGIIARESERSLTLRLGGGVEQEIKIADIKSRQTTGLSLMPEGFEGLGPDNLRDILAYLGGGSSKYRALNLGRSFTTDTGAGLYQSREAKNDTVQPVKYGVTVVNGVPFSLPDPNTTPTGGNVIVLRNGEGNRTYASTLPKSVQVPVGFAAGNLHFLGGVAGWGGGPTQHRPAMKVTIAHADGQKEVSELYTGDVFIDYISGEDVPGSKRVDGLTKRAHVRYFSLPVNDRSPITNLVLESYDNGIAPTTLAITADSEAPKPVEKRESSAAPAAPAPKKNDELPKSGETLPAQAPAGTIRALLIGGGSSHDFEKFFHQADSATLKAAGGIVTAYTSNAEEALTLLPNADVVVLSANHASFGTPDFQKALNAFADAGHGLVIVHAGVWYNWAPVTGYNKRFVGGGTRGHGYGEFTVFNRQPQHPVMAGVPADFKIKDEHYRVMLDAGAPVEILAETEPEKDTQKSYPSVWIVKDPKARIVCTGLGHATEAHSNPAYQRLLTNAVRWAAGK